ncbi:MAG: hypothetical protein KY429_05860 [Actinobacteria bacterium]|nr:hypothetical protein [Actinomycetota bacterium]
MHGVARVDRRTKRLTARLQPGEIAAIDHDDLDRIAAEGLVERRVKAVLNAAESATGRYPNLGPLVLTQAGIPLVDSIGPDLFNFIRDGDVVTIEENRILKADALVAKGVLVDAEAAQNRLDESKRDIGKALEDFAENTLQYIQAEKNVLIEASKLPEVVTQFSHRHVLVVVRGYGYKDDLLSLKRSYISDFRPVLVGVDGGADALLDLGLKPDMIIGDMDSVSTHALTCGAELVLHAYADGTSPGKERLDALGLEHVIFEAQGTSEDIALLLAHEKGAELIVAVGSRSSMIELMDKGRKGMASTFLVRLRVGPKLVDAKGVSELHRAGPAKLELVLLLLAIIFTVLVVIQLSPPGRIATSLLGEWIQSVWFNLRQFFS